MTVKSANGRQALIQGQGRFTIHWVTEADTPCSVKGV